MKIKYPIILWIFLLTGVLGFSEERNTSTSSEIIRNLLMKEDKEADHAIYMKEIVRQLKPFNLLEFGIGYSTKYFLNSCQKVISVEIVTSEYEPPNIKCFINFYRNFSNWIPVAFFSRYHGDMSWAPYKYLGTDYICEAIAQQGSTHQCDDSIEPYYLQELSEFIANLVKFHNIQVAIIHPAIFLRTDIVKACFHKIPIIAAQHVFGCMKQTEYDPYGFRKIPTPSDYEQIFVPTPHGTMIWVLKTPEFQELIAALQKLRKDTDHCRF